MIAANLAKRAQRSAPRLAARDAPPAVARPRQHGDCHAAWAWIASAVYPRQFWHSMVLLPAFAPGHVITIVATRESSVHSFPRTQCLHTAVARVRVAQAVTRADTLGRVSPAPHAVWNDLVTLADPHIRAVVETCACPRGQIEECVQEAWVEVVASLPSVDPAPARGSIVAWLRTIARRSAYRFLRREARARSPAELPPANIPWVRRACQPDPSQPDPAKQLLIRESELALASAVDSLPHTLGPDAHRLVRSYLHTRFKLTQIAAHLDLPHGHFWHLWRRAKMHLRTRLEPPEGSSDR